MSLLNENNHTSELVYDRAKYHFLGQFPSILPIEQAYVYIGMFFGWMLENDLYGKIFEEEEAAQVYRFKRREISAGLLSELWDGYLGADLFNAEGNAFSQYYYQSRLYRKDYEEVLAKDLPTIYHVEDTWENYEKMAQRIKDRYEFWKANPNAPIPEVPEYIIKPEMLTSTRSLFEQALEDSFDEEITEIISLESNKNDKNITTTENSSTTNLSQLEEILKLPLEEIPEMSEDELLRNANITDAEIKPSVSQNSDIKADAKANPQSQEE
ncbi:MAG: hypothetical protein NZ551_07720 [Microscillaceae bacterium]|nr:hypothetical protein [Microscillaceae bacterium]MDW8461084.1 hypothetical protein [Cytophagales bacterium]